MQNVAEIRKSKAMNTNQKDPGCCTNDGGCCSDIIDFGCC